MINYEGINYNIEIILQFQSLKLLLKALAKKINRAQEIILWAKYYNKYKY